MDILEDLHPALTLVIALIALIWLGLLFLVPFMIEGIRSSTRRTHEALAEANRKLDRLAELIANGQVADARPPGRSEVAVAGHRSRPDGSTPGAAASPQRTPTAPRRQEPTISDPTPVPARREPPLTRGPSQRR